MSSSCIARILLFCLVLTGYAHAQVRSDEQVIFFPTAAYPNDRGDWTASLHGWIYEPESGDTLRNHALSSLRGALRVEPNTSVAATMTSRCRWFLVDNERKKKVRVLLGDREIALEPSDSDGHFTGSLTLGSGEAATLSRDGRVSFQAILSPGDTRVFGGEIFLQPPTGPTVITDIDDTIKISEVRDRDKLLANTFLHDFRAVPGMADFLSKLTRSGAVVHYVSSAPWQLYEPLNAFRRNADFPAGAFHLKKFRLKDSTFFDLFADPLDTKPTTIESIIRSSPVRRFILVGDSGEHDPEVYGLIARKFPDRIERILIRNVTSESGDAPRYKEAFRGLSAESWSVFGDAAELMR